MKRSARGERARTVHNAGDNPSSSLCICGEQTGINRQHNPAFVHKSVQKPGKACVQTGITACFEREKVA